MINKIVLMIVVLAVALSACAPTVSPVLPITPSLSPLSSPLEPDSASQGVTVVYHRSGGFAGTDDTWTISLDGTVTHQGSMVGSPEQLTKAQMSELATVIRAANFAALEESYVPQNTCCDRYIYEIAVMVNGETKAVRTIDAAPAAPAELTQLIDTLNQLLLPAK